MVVTPVVTRVQQWWKSLLGVSASGLTGPGFWPLGHDWFQVFQ